MFGLLKLSESLHSINENRMERDQVTIVMGEAG